MEYLTPSNVQLGLSGIYLVVGAPKLLGLATKPFAEIGYPAWLAYVSGLMEVAGAAMVHFDYMRVEGLLLLLVVMGGGMLTMLKVAPPMVISPMAFAYAIFFCLKAHKAADPVMVGGALALGVLGGVLFGGKGKKKAAASGRKPAASKKSK